MRRLVVGAFFATVMASSGAIAMPMAPLVSPSAVEQARVVCTASGRCWREPDYAPRAYYGLQERRAWREGEWRRRAWRERQGGWGHDRGYSGRYGGYR
jgi:hypothetical protein